MCKAKYYIEMKQAVVKEYLSGEGSYEGLLNILNRIFSICVGNLHKKSV